MTSLRIAALTLLLAGCQPAEYAVLIEAHATADIDSYTVTVVDLSGSHSAYPRPSELDPELDPTVDPFRIAIELDGPRRVMVHVVGRDELVPGGSAADPLFVATRCYTVNGVERDEILLVALDDDTDGDTFSSRPMDTCTDRRPDGTSAPCDHACDAGEWTDCRDDVGIEPTAPLISPAGSEICLDGIDQDCRNGDLEECPDHDDDGWNVCAAGQPPSACDCDDSLPLVHPTPGRDEAEEDCNDFIDQNCDGMDLLCDLDGDGSRANRERGGVPDCDDTNPAINPMAPEVCQPPEEDGVDENCNGFVDELEECLGEDFDGDGHNVCRGGATTGCDCNDCDPGVHPGIAAEQCANAVDEDCSGAPVPCPPSDADGDGDACDPAMGTCVVGLGDCDPANPRIYTGAPERCGNLVDESCGPPADDACDATSDRDGDGWIEPPECADDATRTPDGIVTCNGIDDDCDLVVDEMLSAPMPGTPYERHGTVGCSIGMPVDYSNDITHCGFCRNVCNTGGLLRADRCESGICDCAGQPDLGACTGLDDNYCCRDGCVDLNSNPAHCGRCDHNCQIEFPGRVSPVGDACVAQVCVCGTMTAPCAPGLTCCAGLGGECEDIGSDVDHCGGCGISCRRDNVTPSCSGGQCMNTCVAPFDDCDHFAGDGTDVGEDGNGCETNLQSTVAHCGSCGRNCEGEIENAVASCSGGTCGVAECDPGFADCDGVASNGCEIRIEQGDTNNCGACRAVCGLAHTTRHGCAGYACTVEGCESGWNDCDRTASNGCETPLNTIDDCLACDVACDLPNTATNRCGTGGCEVVTCDPGFANCDGMHSNGCEANLNTSTTHCGMCRNACGAMQTCASGTCTCTPGNLDCAVGGGCETPVSTSNCNACANACGGNEGCSTGGCRCGSTTAMLGEACVGALACCGSGMTAVCADLTSSASHCGSCGRACAAGTEQCIGSACQCITNPLDIRACGAGERCCSSLGCVNITSDTRACGGCGITCRAGEVCSGGSCICAMEGARCPATQACCGGQCADTLTNCGACGNACDSDETCTTSASPAATRCCCGSTCASTGPACPGNMPAERCGGATPSCGG